MWDVRIFDDVLEGWIDQQAGLKDPIKAAREWIKDRHEAGVPDDASLLYPDQPTLYRSYCQSSYGAIEFRFLVDRPKEKILIIDIA